MSTAARTEEVRGAKLRKAGAVRGEDIPLGSKDPNNSARRWVRCKDHPGKPFDRYASIPAAGPVAWAEIEKAGWNKTCPSCAATETNPLRLATGSMIYRGDRDETRKYARARCGICKRGGHWVALSLGSKQTGFCSDCTPWARVAFTNEQLEKRSPERKTLYKQIVRVRRLLEGNVALVPTGKGMPFWALAKRHAEKRPAANPTAPGATNTSEVKHLLLYFEDRPIGDIGPDVKAAFTADFVRGSNRRGARTAASARPVLDVLRQMLGFACARGWIEENPFTRGEALGPTVPTYASDRIMTAEEELRLHAVCTEAFAYLLPVFIFVSDAPAHLRDFLRLRWRDVDFTAGIMSIDPGNSRRQAGRHLHLTPRLRAALMSLRGRSKQAVDAPLIPHSVDRCNYDFEKMRGTANVEALTWSDIRRTGAWRLERAGKDTRQIAAALGMTHLDNVAELLRVNTVQAEQEIGSPLFRKLLREQFGLSAQPQNGSVQAEPPKKRLDRGKFLRRLKKFTVEAYAESKPKIPKREAVARRFAEHGWRPTTGPGIRDNMNRCDISEDWETWVPKMLREAGAL